MQELVKWFSGEEVTVRVTLYISVVMFGNHKNPFQNRILPHLNVMNILIKDLFKKNKYVV